MKLFHFNEDVRAKMCLAQKRKCSGISYNTTSVVIVTEVSDFLLLTYKAWAVINGLMVVSR